MKNIVKLDPLISIKDLEDSLRYPVVCRVNEFDQEAVEEFERDFSEAHSTGQPIVPVIIDSYGGSSYGCLSMISTIQNSRLPVATVVTGKAMSAGAVLFAFGTKGYRYMSPHAIYMIHDLACEIDGKVEDIKVEARHIDQMNQSVYGLMAEAVGKPKNFFINLLRKSSNTDLFLTPLEAKRMGIVDVLGVPTLEMNVKVEFKFGI